MPLAHVDVPLNHLVASPANSRKVPHTDEEIAALAASIEAHGLLQNPVVEEPNTADNFPVVVGEGRRRALNLMASDGRLAQDILIPCKQVPPDDYIGPGERSLAENTLRTAMHPADQVEAFTDLQEQGRTVEEIANRFGCAPLTVERRLRLGGVHATIRKAWRAGKLDTASVRAFTVSGNRKEQLRVFKAQEASSYSLPNPHSIRQALTEDKIRGDHHLVRYVGLKAYEAKGGTVTRDLFDAAADDDDGDDGGLGLGTFIDDPTLLRNLATAKLERHAKRVTKEGWKWIEVAPEPDRGGIHRMDRLVAAGEDFSADQKALAGAYITVDYAGKIETTRGLIRPKDAKAARKLVEQQPEESNVTIRPRQSAEGSVEGDARREAGLSQALVEDLEAIRTSSVKAKLAQHHDVAADLLTFQLARRLLTDDHYHQQALDLHARATHTAPAARQHDKTFADDNPGATLFGKQRATLQQTHHPWLVYFLHPSDHDAESEEAATLAAWRIFRAMEPKSKAAVLAWCTAAMVQNQLGFQPGRAVELEAIIEEIRPPLAPRPTAALFWARLSKEGILEILEATGGEDWAYAVKGMKKAELAEYAGDAFRDPTDIEYPLTLEAQAKVRAWQLPGFAAAPTVDPDA